MSLTDAQAKKVQKMAEAIVNKFGGDEDIVLIGAMVFLIANMIARLARDEEAVVSGVEALTRDIMKTATAHWAYYEERKKDAKKSVRQH